MGNIEWKEKYLTTERKRDIRKNHEAIDKY